MSYGRRLALFFVLIAILPTVALAGMLVIVSEDSRQGKADARLSAGLETALVLYEERVDDAGVEARGLAGRGDLGAALQQGDAAAMERFAEDAARGFTAVEVLDANGTRLAAAGRDDAVAFGEVELTSDGEPSGSLRASLTTAQEYAADLGELTGRELVVSRGEEPLAATLSPPDVALEPGESGEVETAEGEFRGRRVALDESDGESLLLLGPPAEGSFLTIRRPAELLLTVFLLLGILFAYALARTLNALHLRVAEQAITDPLTGLWNRRRWRQRLETEVARATRFEHELSLLIVDVDEFKQINDRRGHPQGDAVLEAIATVVRRSTRSIDIAARYGGDELAVVLVETDADGALVVAERLRSNVAETKVRGPDGSTLRVTVSVGSATLPASATAVDELIEAADQALLRAKREGKNRVQMAPVRRARRAKVAR